ncbi:MAG: Hpt domain-containing protein [Sulfurimonas sp.]|nr:Hpt domain-containing protein [Sulfurimonas sp.]
MLIYNFQKEFIGIDEADLEVFGFANLSELKAESSDFADMFVRTPGYIHNFKHVHWIDFVTCADPSEQSKVIIEINSKTFKAILDIETIYLSDNPTSKAYLIHLNNLRSLTLQENGEFSEDIARKKPPKIEPTVGHAFNLSKEEEAEIEEVPELEGFKPFEDIQDTPEVHEEVQEIQEPTPAAPLDISFDDDDIDTSMFETSEEKPAKVETPTVEIEKSVAVDPLSLDLDDLGFEEEQIPQEKTQAVAVEEDDGFDYSYNFDPQVASDELGLPIDLIEEFIQDFIAQAKEFKDELYSSLDEGDTDNVKILSHKLKGVAANLRIEDAFNTLSIINTSSDITEVGKYLNIFYKIIAKLSGEEIQVAQPAATQASAVEPEEETIEIQEPTVKDDDIFGDDILLDFKEEEPEEEKEPQKEPEEEDDDLYLDFDVGIKDSEVPQKIEMPELADDDFLNDESEDTVDIDDLLSIDEEVNTKDLEIDSDNIESMHEEDEIDIDLREIEEPTVEKEAEELLDIEYSKELIANEIGLDQESFNEIFEDYIQDSQSSADTIREAITEGDFTKCKKETLKLKGMSDNMRVHAFKDELNSLTSSTDKDMLLKAVTKIDAVIAQISK